MRGKVNSIYSATGGGEVEVYYYKLDLENEQTNLASVSELKKVVVAIDTSLMTAGSVEVKDSGVTKAIIPHTELSYEGVFWTSTTLTLSTTADFAGEVYFSSQLSSGRTETLGELVSENDSVQVDVSENTLASMLIGGLDGAGSIVVDRGSSTEIFPFGNEEVYKKLGINQTTTFTLKPYQELSEASYDSLRLDVGSQEGNPYSLTINSDGTKLFVLGISSDTIYQFALNVEDISLSTYDGISFSVGGQDTTPRRAIFNSDYTKLYVLGAGTDSIYQYSITDDSDISTASYDSKSYAISGQDTSPYSVFFNSDYSKFYVLGDINNSIYQYTMGAGGDISLSSYDGNSLNVGAQDIYPYEAILSPDGSKLYVIGLDNSGIFEYTMDESNISNCIYNNIFLELLEPSNPTAMCFSANGGKLLVGALDDYIYQYSFGRSISGTTYISVEY